MHYILKVDQQVWERHTVRIEVPDDTPEDKLLEVLIEKYEDQEYASVGLENEGNVDGSDPQYTYEFDWFTEQP